MGEEQRRGAPPAIRPEEGLGQRRLGKHEALGGGGWVGEAVRVLEKTREKQQRQSWKNRPWKRSEDKERGEPLTGKAGCGRGEREDVTGNGNRDGDRETGDSRGNRGLSGVCMGV